jgi:hypothetical protein
MRTRQNRERFINTPSPAENFLIKVNSQSLKSHQGLPNQTEQEL